MGTREARVAGRLALAGRLQRAIPGLKVNVQSPRALDGSREAAATGLDGVGWVGGGGQVAGPAGPAGGLGRVEGQRAGVNPNPALTFLPPSASRLSKQANS